MDENAEVFAAAIKKDPKLAGGFNAVGFSQGNSVVRGYIQKYNNPTVSTWLSVHGTVVGVSSFPKCNPSPKFNVSLMSVRLFNLGWRGDLWENGAPPPLENECAPALCSAVGPSKWELK